MPVARQLGAIQTRVFGNVSNVSKFELIVWVGENRQTALTPFSARRAPEDVVGKVVQTGARRRSCDYEPQDKQ